MTNSTDSDVSLLASHLFHGSLVLSGAAIISVNTICSCMFIEFRKALLAQNSNKILLSLTFADSMVGVSSIILGILLLLKKISTIYTLFGVLPLFGSMFTSIFSLIVLTIDRWIAIKFPLQHKILMYPKKVKILIALAWVISFLITLMKVGIFVFVSKSFELRFRGFLLFAFFIFGAILLLATNASLILVVRKRSTFLNRNSVLQTKEQAEDLAKIVSDKQGIRVVEKSKLKVYKKKFRRELKAAKTCIIISLLFICCWVPLTSYRLCYSLGYELHIVWLRRTCLLFATLNSLLNPWVYLMKRSGFRAYIKKMKMVRYFKRKSGGFDVKNDSAPTTETMV